VVLALKRWIRFLVHPIESCTAVHKVPGSQWAFTTLDNILEVPCHTVLHWVISTEEVNAKYTPYNLLVFNFLFHIKLEHIGHMFLQYLVPHAVLHVISISIVFPQLLFVHAEMQDGKGLVHMPPSSKIDRYQVHKVSFTSISLHFCLGLQGCFRCCLRVQKQWVTPYLQIQWHSYRQLVCSQLEWTLMTFLLLLGMAVSHLVMVLLISHSLTGLGLHACRGCQGGMVAVRIRHNLSILRQKLINGESQQIYDDLWSVFN
jgi:hypothetical protein